MDQSNTGVRLMVFWHGYKLSQFDFQNTINREKPRNRSVSKSLVIGYFFQELDIGCNSQIDWIPSSFQWTFHFYSSRSLTITEPSSSWVKSKMDGLMGFDWTENKTWSISVCEIERIAKKWTLFRDERGRPKRLKQRMSSLSRMTGFFDPFSSASALKTVHFHGSVHFWQTFSVDRSFWLPLIDKIALKHVYFFNDLSKRGDDLFPLLF